MAGRFDDLIHSTFEITEDEGEDKVMGLREAIERSVKLGARLHVGTTHCCSNAAIIEIARQFHRKKPRFTLIMRGIRALSF